MSRSHPAFPWLKELEHVFRTRKRQLSAIHGASDMALVAEARAIQFRVLIGFLEEESECLPIELFTRLRDRLMSGWRDFLAYELTELGSVVLRTDRIPIRVSTCRHVHHDPDCVLSRKFACARESS